MGMFSDDKILMVDPYENLEVGMRVWVHPSQEYGTITGFTRYRALCVRVVVDGRPEQSFVHHRGVEVVLEPSKETTPVEEPESSPAPEGVRFSNDAAKFAAAIGKYGTVWMSTFSETRPSVAFMFSEISELKELHAFIGEAIAWKEARAQS